MKAESSLHIFTDGQEITKLKEEVETSKKHFQDLYENVVRKNLELEQEIDKLRVQCADILTIFTEYGKKTNEFLQNVPLLMEAESTDDRELVKQSLNKMEAWKKKPRVTKNCSYVIRET